MSDPIPSPGVFISITFGVSGFFFLCAYYSFVGKHRKVDERDKKINFSRVDKAYTILKASLIGCVVSGVLGLVFVVVFKDFGSAEKLFSAVLVANVVSWCVYLVVFGWLTHRFSDSPGSWVLFTVFFTFIGVIVSFLMISSRISRTKREQLDQLRNSGS
ncbi:hypothetical protein [Teredinibacter sp. KSP-S5-2]|uniref:hypothetical protein n=1 Tax=Teredinibacter sp. KSP-S5-2 TaxID=3034506 RepID=UPI00293519D4|nr:hypothetical protein [Teredinibacter sp. KSP-S5-2]WNO11180.1 hypothetical protein P5V12_08340 [Teredinibacter sp. KSP-S5-2]